MAFKPMKTAVIGCGMISDIYLKNLKETYKITELVGCSDIIPERSAKQAEKYGIRQMTNEEIFADPEIEMVVNITYPTAHFEVSRRALEAGKHVYCEKMTTLTVEESTALLELAQSKGLFVGGAADTFLCGATQTARMIIDSGIVGAPVMANALLARSYHHERFNTAPYKRFAFCPGGGIIFDMGSYYLSELVFLLGPIKRVAGFSQIRNPHRTFANPDSPLYGQPMEVESYNNTTGVLEFESGVLGNITMTSESAKGTDTFQIFCTDGTIDLGDPNTYRTSIKIIDKVGKVSEIVTNFGYKGDNFRGLGVADAVYAIRNNRPARCSGELNRHVLEAALGICQSSEDGKYYEMTTRCERPEPFKPGYTERQEMQLEI